MRDLIQLIEQAQNLGDPIVRSAFIYLPPTVDPDTFAQCSSCESFISNRQLCRLFSDKDKVIANASCGLYVQGQPSQDGKTQNIVTPEEAGYNVGQVRCENCKWLDETNCSLFSTLNDQLPDIFDLDIAVDLKGCCNAWQGS